MRPSAPSEGNGRRRRVTANRGEEEEKEVGEGRTGERSQFTASSPGSKERFWFPCFRTGTCALTLGMGIMKKPKNQESQQSQCHTEALPMFCAWTAGKPWSVAVGPEQ